MEIVRETLPVGPLQCNCTIIGDRETGRGYVFDPGGDPDEIMAIVEHLGLRIEALIHTHAHLDHFLAAGDIRRPHRRADLSACRRQVSLGCP